MIRPGRVGHQAAHRAELADVALVSSGAGGGHHRDRAVDLEALHHLVGHRARRLLPDVDDLLVALVLGDEAALELAVDLGDVVVGRLEPRALVLRDLDVEDADRHPAAGREVEADALDAVGEVGGLVRAEHPVALVDELLELGPDHDLVRVAELVGQDLVEEDPADGRPAPLGAELAGLGVPGLDLGLDRLVEGDARSSPAAGRRGSPRPPSRRAGRASAACRSDPSSGSSSRGPCPGSAR